MSNPLDSNSLLNKEIGETIMKETTIDKIIGREPRLTDILLALDKKRIDSPNKDTYVIYPDGEFLEMHIGTTKRTGAFWDLKHDNLEDQSEPTKQFLADLLGGVK